MRGWTVSWCAFGGACSAWAARRVLAEPGDDNSEYAQARDGGGRLLRSRPRPPVSVCTLSRMMGSAAHKDVGDGSDIAGGGQERRHGELDRRERDRPATPASQYRRGARPQSAARDAHGRECGRRRIVPRDSEIPCISQKASASPPRRLERAQSRRREHCARRPWHAPA